MTTSNSTFMILSTAKTNVGKQIQATLDFVNYYIFLGNHIPAANNPEPIVDSIAMADDCYRNMICGKKVTAADLSLIVNYHPWVSGTTFTMYDDQDPDLLNKNFYCTVNDDAFWHTFKCLDNNQNSPSTIEPDISQIDPQDTMYRTSDGYLWKYLYSVDSATASKFKTPYYFPVATNTAVSEAAVPGAIDVIKIETAGIGYSNWMTGSFNVSGIQVAGNTLTYAISDKAVSVNGYYTGCNLYISSGTGAGQYKTISDYYSNANGNFVVVDSDFTVTPTNTTEYEIYPTINLSGTGQTTNAAARGLVNAISNSIYLVDILDRGAGYSYVTATAIANSVVNPQEIASIRPILPPYSGHGDDPATELGSTKISFSVLFSGDEGNTIPATNIFRQIGLIANPQFANIQVNLQAVPLKNFSITENVLTFNKRYLGTGVQSGNNSSNLISTGFSWEAAVRVGDSLLIQSNQDQIDAQMVSVTGISNNSVIQVNPPSTFAKDDVDVYLCNILDSGIVVTDYLGATVTLDGIKNDLPSNTNIIGLQSGALGTVSNLTIGDQTKSLDTFVGLSKFVANSVSGTFLQNEALFQANSTALIHSVSSANNLTTILASNNFGTWTTGQAIQGDQSDASAVLQYSFGPDIKFGTGKILYAENIDAVSRGANETEQLSLIIGFDNPTL